MPINPALPGPSGRRVPARPARAAAITVLIGLLLTAGVFFWVTRSLREEGHLNLLVEAERMSAEIEARMSVYSAILASGAGLFHASDMVTRDDWHDYAASLQLARNYPGIQSLAYSARLPAAAMSGASELYPVRYVEPDNARNHRTIGFDLYAEPTRRAAMHAAAAAGTPRLSAVVSLVQEKAGEQPGVLMFMPVYRRGAPVADAAQRSAAVQGYIHAAFRTHDLLRSILGAQRGGVGLELADSAMPARRLFVRAPEGAAAGLGAGQTVTRNIAVAGRTWQARYFAPWDFGIAYAAEQQAAVLTAGLLITLLGAMVVWGQTHTQVKSVRLAHAMTAELRAGQARFERMVDGTSDGVWEVNLGSGAVYCSPRCKGLLGAAAAGVALGRRWARARVDPRDCERVIAAFSACVAARGELDLKLRVRIGAPDGAGRWFRVRARVFDAAGGDLYMSGALSDIQAQEESQEREDRLLGVIESSPDIALTFSPAGETTYLNAAARRVFGAAEPATPAEGLAAGLPVATAFAQSELARIAARLANSGPHGLRAASGATGVWQGETEVTTADGHLLPVSQVIVAHCDALGDVQYYSAVMRDISSRRRVEAALKEVQARYRRALAGANDGVWELNLASGSFFCSSRFEDLLGLPPGGGPRTNLEVRALIHPDDLEGHLDATWELGRSTRPHTWDLRLACRAAAGGAAVHRWFRLRGIATFDQDGGAILTSGTLTEIDAAKRAEQELQRHRDDLAGLVEARTASAEAARAEAEKAREAAEAANRSKSAFLANMSHELRTPMHAILSFANFGVEKAGDAERDKLARYFGNIQRGGARLLALLNDLLDLSKLEAGKMEMRLARVDAAELLREAIGEAEALAKSREIWLRLQVQPQMRAAQLDAPRMLQVIGNLLSNAIKFSPPGGRVDVMLAALPDGIEIRVRDEGIGIPEAELEAVFDKFVQSSKTNTGAGGTGLGLAICREIVHAHQGSIHACNNPAPRNGTCFVVSLPAACRLAGGALGSLEAA